MTNEKIITDFLAEVKDMLEYYKDPKKRIVDETYDVYIKFLFFDLFREFAGKMKASIDIFEPSKVKTVDIAKTTNELIAVLKLWPKGTDIVVNVAEIVEDPAGDYQWHYLKPYAPSKSELKAFKKDPKLLTHTVIDIDLDVQGC